MEKYSYPYVFWKGYFQHTLLLFPSRYGSSDDTYKVSISEAAVGIDEKATEETADQNFSNAKLFATNIAHTSMTPRGFGAFLTNLITPSVGTNDNSLKPTRTGNLQPSVTFAENLRSIARQIRPQARVISVKRQKFSHWQQLADSFVSKTLFSNHFIEAY